MAVSEIFFYTFFFKLSHRKKITISELRTFHWLLCSQTSQLQQPWACAQYVLQYSLTENIHIVFCIFLSIEGGIYYIADILIWIQFVEEITGHCFAMIWHTIFLLLHWVMSLTEWFAHFFTTYSFILHNDMTTEVKWCLTGYDWIHDTVVHILQQLVTKENSCCIICLFEPIHNHYFLQSCAKFNYSCGCESRS